MENNAQGAEASNAPAVIINESPINRFMEVGMCPTGANAYRWMNCLDSWRLELMSKSTSPQVISAENERGAHIHRALEHIDNQATLTKVMEDLSLDEKVSVNACETHYWALLEKVFGDGDGVEIVKDKRFYLKFEGENIASMKVARIAYRASTGTLMIPDFKTGSREIPAPEVNPQMQVSLACVVFELVGLGIDVREATGAIIQPLFVEPVRTKTYDKDSLLALVNNVMGVALEAKKESAELRLKAGEWCEWCSAKNICPIRKTIVSRVLSISEKIERVSDSQLSDMLMQVSVVKKICKALEEEAMNRLLKNPCCLPNHSLELGADVKMGALDDLEAKYDTNIQVAAVIKKFVMKVPTSSSKRVCKNSADFLKALQEAGVDPSDLQRIVASIKKEKS